MKRVLVAVALVAAVLAAVDGVEPAGARWAYGAGPSDVDLTTVADDGYSVCSDRVTGRVGIHGAGDETTRDTFVAPPGPYGTATVRVYVSDQPFGEVTEEPGGAIRRVSDGVVVPLLTSQTTGQLQLLTPPDVYPFGQPGIVYAGAPFDIAYPSGSVHAGDYLAVKKPGSVPAQATVVNCSVRGYVRDASGNPIRNAVVRIGTRTAFTGPTGSYQLTGVANGSYQATANAACRPTAQQAVTVTGALPVTLDIVMQTSTACTVDTQVWDPTSTVLSLTGDNASVQISLPFPYRHYGVTYGTAHVSTNGVVNFLAANTSGANTLIPNTAAPNAAIYPFWDDLLVDAEASVRTGTVGTAPYRRFVIEWRNVALAADPFQRLTFQVVLYENPNQRVRLQYRSIEVGSAASGTSATVGIETAAGTSANVVSHNQGVLYDGLSVRPK